MQLILHRTQCLLWKAPEEYSLPRFQKFEVCIESSDDMWWYCRATVQLSICKTPPVHVE